MKTIRPFFFLFVLLVSTGSFAQNRDISYMSAGGKLRPLQAIMDIRHYTLALDVDIPKKSIGGYAEIDLLLSKTTDTLLFDLVHLLRVSKITVDKKDAGFEQKGDSIFIVNNNSYREGKHIIRINYGGEPPVAVRPPWKGGFTWTTDKAGNPWVVINCQLEGAKVYFPCKDHPSDEPNEGIDLFVTIPKGLSVAGPGLLQGVKNRANNRATWHWKTNYTISNYCVVFNIAKYKVYSRPYTTVGGHTVPIQFYVLEEDTAHAEHVLDIRARDTRILEKYFGEYPWFKEKIGIAEVPNPGMEHQTMVTYGDRFKYDKYPGGLDYSANLFHEFGHEWWANKVTNKDWAHMWIQEGINTYAEALFFKETLGEAAYDSVIISQRAGIRNQQPVVKAEEMGMAEVYNGDIYSKGSFFMHTMRHVLGDSVFFPALKKFVTDVKYPYNKFFTTQDVQHFFNKESGCDLSPLFNFYLRTTNTMDFELKRTRPNIYILSIKNSPMELPLDILTHQGIIHTTISANKSTPFKIVSKTQPVVDPKGWYFKKVIMQ
ncbi:M1 family metallopeptidase [Mucilaginibacter sp.]|uniref:M1 family metallopeptidase n=1 Tax=Mucilaginibacter sp. TaxID=1882438 RepID=UPI003265CFB9